MPTVDGFRAKLGMILVLTALIGLTLLSAVALLTVREPDHYPEMVRYIYASLLPMFGTWVGTVLAFYFSKENFEAAQKGNLDLFRTLGLEKLRSTPVATAMVARSKMIVLTVTAAIDLPATPVNAVDTEFARTVNGDPITRLVVLDVADKFVAIIHRSTWSEMNVLGLKDPKPLAAGDTIANLLSKPYPTPLGPTYQDFLTKSISFVAQGANLADTKSAMEAVPKCQDALVTANGAPAGPVLGWITNTDLGRLSQA